MSNTEYLRSLYAAMDGLLTDLDANGSAEMAANSLRYHLKEHGLSIRSEGAAPRAEGDECTTSRWCAENGCQHRMSLVELLRVESRLGEDGYRLVPLDDAIRAVNAAGTAPRAEGLDVDWRNVCIARVDWADSGADEAEAWEAWIGVSPTDAGLRRHDRTVGIGANPREAVRDLAARLAPQERRD